ncbi:MAG: amidophosphoribosyltransferase [Bacteroidales bacterium]|nr:amidophosphoribosyltransferase [Bacteroidales bacterium]
MERFTIYAKDSWCDTKDEKRRTCLRHDTDAFYHAEYHGGGNWKIAGTIENLICTFKNDITPYSKETLDDAMLRLCNILIKDFREILSIKGGFPLTICVIPRAKHEEHYRSDQRLFRQAVRIVIKFLNNKGDNRFIDGTHNIIRHTDTPTTHLHEGRSYCGVTKDTCNITGVKGKNILLVDDLYTKTVCIDEDAIQALYDNGANSVIFYSVGKTIMK